MKKATFAKRVGASLRKRREALEISQEDFAARVHMHRTYYSSIERGQKNIRLDTLERVCAALKTRVWEVVKDAE